MAKRTSSAQVRSEMVFVRVTPDQRRLFEQSAAKSGVRLSIWMRSILLQVADPKAPRGRKSDGYIRIREPDGVTT